VLCSGGRGLGVRMQTLAHFGRICWLASLAFATVMGTVLMLCVGLLLFGGWRNSTADGAVRSALLIAISLAAGRAAR
jgi:hypothetical protein